MRGFAHVNWINYPSELQSTLMAVGTSRVKKKKRAGCLHVQSTLPVSFSVSLSLSLSLVDAALRFFQFFPPTEIFVPFHRIFPRPFRLTLRPGSPVLSSFVFTGRYLSIYKSFYSRPARQTATQQQQPRFSGRRVYATLGPLGARTNKRLAKPS